MNKTSERQVVAAAQLATQTDGDQWVELHRNPVAAPVWLDQNQASKFLEMLGVKRAPRTLQKQRVTGGGPPFRKACSRVIYEREALRSWAEAQHSPEVSSTSELAPRFA